jgi:hypothetical protein
MGIPSVLKNPDKMSIRELRREVKELREGKCRFKCRGQKSAFIAGYLADLDHVAERSILMDDARVAYREWRATESDD